jgi:hypothetical protein
MVREDQARKAGKNKTKATKYDLEQFLKSEQARQTREGLPYGMAVEDNEYLKTEQRRSVNLIQGKMEQALATGALLSSGRFYLRREGGCQSRKRQRPHHSTNSDSGMSAARPKASTIDPPPRLGRPYFRPECSC